MENQFPDGERKILFFDIDGTLITDDERRIFPESAKKAIRMAKARRHLNFINTGRVYINVDDFIREAGFDGYVCGCGTHIIVDGKTLFHTTPKRSRCVEIARLARACGLQVIYEYSDFIAYDKMLVMPDAVELMAYFRRQNRRVLNDIESPEFVFDKFIAWYRDLSDVTRFMDQVTDFCCVARGGNFIEVVPNGYTKATGIRYLLDYYHIPVTQAYVFGDSNNDLEMLQYVPNSVAMGSCSPDVKAAASYQTTQVEQDGIYKAMEHFGVIE